jgi:hypothetical protein
MIPSMTLDDVGLDEEEAALKGRAELIATEVLAAIDHALEIALRAIVSAQTWTVEDNPGRRLALIEVLLGLEAQALAQ